MSSEESPASLSAAVVHEAIAALQGDSVLDNLVIEVENKVNAETGGGVLILHCFDGQDL